MKTVMMMLVMMSGVAANAQSGAWGAYNTGMGGPLPPTPKFEPAPMPIYIPEPVVIRPTTTHCRAVMGDIICQEY